MRGRDDTFPIEARKPTRACGLCQVRGFPGGAPRGRGLWIPAGRAAAPNAPVSPVREP